MFELRLPKFGDCWDDLSGYPQAPDPLVSGGLVGHRQKNGASAMGLQRVLGLGSYKTAWTWLHKLRRAMVRPGRDRLTGRVEVDETYVGGVEEGTRGRQTERKALVAIAAQEDGPGIGRIRCVASWTPRRKACCRL